MTHHARRAIIGGAHHWIWGARQRRRKHRRCVTRTACVCLVDVARFWLPRGRKVALHTLLSLSDAAPHLEMSSTPNRASFRVHACMHACRGKGPGLGGEEARNERRNRSRRHIGCKLAFQNWLLETAHVDDRWGMRTTARPTKRRVYGTPWATFNSAVVRRPTRRMARIRATGRGRRKSGGELGNTGCQWPSGVLTALPVCARIPQRKRPTTAAACI
jgi:hypothetical protein